MFSMTPGASAYGWASVVKALEKQDVVQLNGPGLTRWLSLSEGSLGERSSGRRTLLDLRNNQVLERRDGDEFVRRRTVSGQSIASDHDRLVLAFLLGNSQTAGLDRLQGARIVGESWDYATSSSKSDVILKVTWATDQSHRIDVRLRLDRHTSLPIDCSVTDSGSVAETLAWAYNGSPAPQIRVDDFPADLALVDVDDRGNPLVKTAIVNPTDTSRNIPNDLATPNRTDPTAKPPGSVALWGPVKAPSQPRREVVRKIDTILEGLWQENGVAPAPIADDEELLRRVYLDLTGRTPSVHEIRTYLADKSPDRYEQLVDRLLQNRDHASHLATIWRGFLIPDGIDLTAFGGVTTFDRWLADQFGRNEPYDATVRELLLAEGRLSRSGPLLFYSAAKLDPDVLAARSARAFLGLRLDCAQCHNHPFEPWTQEEFWGFAAFYAQISRPQGELQTVSTVMQVRDVDHGEVKLPKSDTVIAPHFLTAGTKYEPRPNESRRQQLAQWMTSRENPYFSRAAANRVWAILFGKGIVEPVDDFGVRHPARSQELLDLLAGQFVSTDFDLRELFRTVALSRAYRLSSGAPTADPNRPEWFAQMNVKTLTAEQVYDCIAVATLLENSPAADPYAFNVARYGNASRDQFLQQFRTPAGRSTEYLGGIPQALTLMNGGLIDNATGLSNSGLLKSLDAPFFTNRQRVEVLYLAALSRYPRSSEWELLNEYITDQTPPSELRENLSDILWALLNSAEFTMNH
jgi:hypothetical protein